MLAVARKKSWKEKLKGNPDLPKVVIIDSKMAGRLGCKTGDTMVIPSPSEVDELMKKVPSGKVVTVSEIREAVARKYKVTMSCPLTTGIFAWIAAWAAEEGRKEGKKEITPYWRTLKSGGFLNEKYPGGIEAQKVLLEREGHRIVKKGQKHQIKNFTFSLFTFD